MVLCVEVYMSDLKKTIFDFLDDNQDILKKENCNEILFKKFYPNAKEFEKDQKKKYISKVKNEYIKKFSDDLKEVEKVPIKLGEVPEPVKNIPGELDLQVIKNVVSDKIKENLILSIPQQQKLLFSCVKVGKLSNFNNFFKFLIAFLIIFSFSLIFYLL